MSELTDEFFTGTVTDPILQVLNHHQRTPLPGFICCCGEEFETAHGYRLHVRSFLVAVFDRTPWTRGYFQGMTNS